MRLIIFVFLGVLLLAGCSNPPANPSIIPKPASLTLGSSSLAVSSFKISAPESEEGQRLADFLAEALKLRSLDTSPKGIPVSLSIVVYDTLVPEGFHNISVDDAGVRIQSNSPSGVFYGIQSFLQLVTDSGSKGKIPHLSITDYPRFPYRGLHLDVGRHFFPPSFVKQYIDWLAFHKLNYFHWHLTEDQGWRIEIKKFPALQTVASQRKETLIGHAGIPEKFDGTPYGGFYTQEEVKEIVAYAALRYVTILPEIEMPGHSLAALSAYPNLGCTGGPYEAATKWGVFPDVFCAGKEETFTFIEQVLDEVIALFPGPYVHIGGDECPKDSWKVCPRCQIRIKSEKLEDEHELQSYFIQRVEKYLNSKDRKLIGWDEILEGGLAQNATVMSWRGEAGGIAAAKQNHFVIMTPGDWLYFDHYQDSSKGEPLAIGGYTPVSQVYAYDPVPSSLTPEEAEFILGAQANLWTEYIATPEQAAYMAYPRACALAEVVWSPQKSRDYEDFVLRMKNHFPRLKELGINYAPHLESTFKTP